MKIILYSTNCPKCKVLEKKLNMKNLSYQIETDIDKMLSLNIRSAPVLEIDGVRYDFSEANSKINSL